MVLALVVFAIATAIWVVVEWLAVLGLAGMLMGERIERCQRCHGIGLTSGGRRHPEGCPAHSGSRVSHRVRALASRLKTLPAPLLERPLHFGHH